MSKTQEALKLALEALERAAELLTSVGLHFNGIDKAITAIREALADIGNPITEQLSIPTVITCPFCSSEHIPGWLHDYNMDRGAYGEQPAQRCPLCNYQHGHSIGCKNNPVDIALNKMAENARELGLDYAITQTGVGIGKPMSDHRLMEQPAQQEPVYFCDYGYEGWGKVDAAMAAENLACGMTVEAYYTSPSAQRKPLTDEEIGNDPIFRAGVRFAESKHGIGEKK